MPKPWPILVFLLSACFPLPTITAGPSVPLVIPSVSASVVPTSSTPVTNPSVISPPRTETTLPLQPTQPSAVSSPVSTPETITPAIVSSPLWPPLNQLFPLFPV